MLCAEILLIGLGVWQVQRLQWKTALIAEIAQAQAQPALTSLPKALTGLEYRTVRLSGHFLEDKTLRQVGGRQGERSGFFLLTPFMLKDGRTILVNRGFAPKDAQIAAPPQEITGILRPPRGKKVFFLPDNQPEENVWIYEDMEAMAKHAGAALLPMVIEATGKYEKSAYPIPNAAKVVLRNDHLGYAVTWFGLALVGLIWFGFYYRKKET